MNNTLRENSIDFDRSLCFSHNRGLSNCDLFRGFGICVESGEREILDQQKEKYTPSIAKCVVEHGFILQLRSARHSNDMKNRDHFRES
jgi:hypothetical protein